MDRQEVKGTTQQEYGTRTDSAEGDRLHGARLDAVCKARQRGPNGLLRVTGHILWNGETYNSHFFYNLVRCVGDKAFGAWAQEGEACVCPPLTICRGLRLPLPAFLPRR